jgi:hypothetical protein
MVNTVKLPKTEITTASKNLLTMEHLLQNGVQREPQMDSSNSLTQLALTQRAMSMLMNLKGQAFKYLIRMIRTESFLESGALLERPTVNLAYPKSTFG